MNARRTSAAAPVGTVAAARTTINLRRRGVLVVAGTAVIAAASLGATATAYAKKGDDTKNDVRKSAACGTGQLKLKAKTESGNRLELEAEVDSNLAGQEWTVTLSNDGKTVWTGKRTTAGPSGSFSVETTIDADATEATPTQSPTSSTTTPSTSTTTSSSTTTTPAPPTSDDGSSTATASPSTGDDSSSTATASPSTGDDSSSTATASPSTGDDKGGSRRGLRAASSKDGEDKPGDDKGGDNKSKPATGKHVIGVIATLNTLTCATDLTV